MRWCGLVEDVSFSTVKSFILHPLKIVRLWDLREPTWFLKNRLWQKNFIKTRNRFSFSQVFKKEKELKKGIAFPTCISVNNCVCHFSPTKNDPDYVLKTGDVVKMWVFYFLTFWNFYKLFVLQRSWSTYRWIYCCCCTYIDCRCLSREQSHWQASWCCISCLQCCPDCPQTFEKWK